MSEKEIRIPEGETIGNNDTKEKSDAERLADAEKFWSLDIPGHHNTVLKNANGKHNPDKSVPLKKITPEMVLNDTDVYDREKIKNWFREYLKDEWDGKDIPQEYLQKIEDIAEKFMKEIDKRIRASLTEDKQSLKERVDQELATKLAFI